MKKRILFFLVGIYSEFGWGLNLQETLIHTYQHNSELKATYETLKASKENKTQALGEFLPTVGASLKQTWNDSKRVGFAQNINNNIPWQRWQETSKGLTVSQPLFNGGGSVANFKKVQSQFNAEQINFLNKEQQTLFAAITSYANVVEAIQLVELSQKKIKAFSEHYYSAVERKKLEEATEFEVAKAHSRLKKVESEFFQNTGNLAASKASFQNITHLEASNLDIPDINQFKNLYNLEELKSVALNENLQILASNHYVEATKYDIFRQGSKFLPSAQLSYSITKDRNHRDLHYKDYDKAVSLSVTIPIYQAGVEYASLKSSKKLHSAAKYKHSKTVDDITEEIVRAWYGHQVALSVIDSALAEEHSAKIALQSAKEEFEMQTNTITDVLDAEQDLYEAYVEYIKACTNLMKAYYYINLTIGKLTAKELALNVPLYEINIKRR
jgi:outer membrane protein